LFIICRETFNEVGERQAKKTWIKFLMNAIASTDDRLFKKQQTGNVFKYQSILESLQIPIKYITGRVCLSQENPDNHGYKGIYVIILVQLNVSQCYWICNISCSFLVELPFFKKIVFQFWS
jgi:hypothetical protein